MGRWTSELRRAYLHTAAREQVCVWDGWTSELLASFPCGGGAWRLSFSPDGETLACLGRVAVLPRGETADSAAKSPSAAAAAPHKLPPGAAAQAATAATAATAAAAAAAAAACQTIELHWWRRGALRSSLQLRDGGGHGGPLRAVAWLPQSSISATSGEGGGTRLVLLGRRTLLFARAVEDCACAGAAAVEAASFGENGAPSGRLRALLLLERGLLVTGSSSGEVQLWSAATLVRRTQAHAGRVRALAAIGSGWDT